MTSTCAAHCCSWHFLPCHVRTATRTGSHSPLVWPPKPPNSGPLLDVGPHHCCSIPSVHPGTAYQHMSGSSIGGSFGGSFSGGMPSGLAGGGGGSLAAMLAAQQGFGFVAGSGGLGPWGSLDAQGADHAGQPGGFARVSGPQPVPGIVNPFAAANRSGGSGAPPGPLTSGSGTGTSMFNAALALGGVSGTGQFASRAGVPGCLPPPAPPHRALHRLWCAVHPCKSRRAVIVAEGSAGCFFFTRPCKISAILSWWLS